jgi:hypothetical protein
VAVFPFQALSRKPPFDDVGKREELRARLNEISGVNIDPGALAGKPRRSLRVR